MKRRLNDPRALVRAASVALAGGLVLWSVTLMLGRKGPVERSEPRSDSEAPLFPSSDAPPAMPGTGEDQSKVRDAAPSILPVLTEARGEDAAVRKDSKEEGAGSASPAGSDGGKDSLKADLKRIMAKKLEGVDGRGEDAESKDSPAEPEESAKEQRTEPEQGSKPALQKMPSKFQSADRASGGFASAGADAASSSGQGKPRLNAAPLLGFLSQASNRAFMAPKIGGSLKALTGGGRRVLNTRTAARPSLGGVSGAAGAGQGALTPAVGFPGGGNAAGAQAGGGGGGGDPGQQAWAGAAAGKAGGGGGPFGGLPADTLKKKEPAAHAEKQDRGKIQERADRHLAAANKYKKDVVIPLVAHTWSQDSLPKLQNSARLAQESLLELDRGVQAAMKRYSGAGLQALAESHAVLAGKPSSDIGGGGNLIGRLRTVQDDISIGLRDILLLPNGCEWMVRVPVRRKADPWFPRAGVTDLPIFGFDLPEPRSHAARYQYDGETYFHYSKYYDCDTQHYTDDCEPRTFAEVNSEDASVLAHLRLEGALSQALNARTEAKRAAKLLPEKFAAAAKADPAHAFDLRALSEKVRSGLESSADLIPDPPRVEPAVDAATRRVQPPAEQGRREIFDLLTTFDQGLSGFPDTGHRAQALKRTQDANDSAQLTVNTLSWFTGRPNESAKGLVELSKYATQTLISTCRSYHAMSDLAKDAQ